MDYQANNEDTKEIENLNILKNKEEIDTLEMECLEEMDANIETADEEFEKAVNNFVEQSEENVEEELKQQDANNKNAIDQKDNDKKKKTLKEKMQNLKEKWLSLPKKKKITIIVISAIILIALIIGIILLVTRKNDNNIPVTEDIIVDLDNYRYQNGKLIFLDEDKKEIGEYSCKNEDQELCYVAYLNDEDDFDAPKYIYENDENISIRSSIYLNQYVFVYDNKAKEDGLITLYDIKNQKEIDDYLLVKAYNNLKNQVILKNKNGQYGLYRLTSENITPVVDFQYDYLGVLERKEAVDRMISKQNGKWYLTDFNNKTLTKPIDREIKEYNDHYIKVVDENGRYYIVDYNANYVKTDDFDYIDLLDNHALFIKDKKLYIEDYEKNKMNIEGIELENTNYIPVQKYSKDKKLISTEKSYEITYQGSNINIEIFTSDGNSSNKKMLNLMEGKTSASLKNYSYFDGKIYIYKDAAKTELLGSYTCQNKNNITEGSTDLSRCNIAHESYYQDNDMEKVTEGDMGVLPVFNERFLFISDGENIVLYDLKENAEKAKYKSVDTGTYSKTNDLTFVSSNNNHIIAENGSEKYGIIKMDYTSLNKVKEFDCNHIERIGLYYIIQNSSGYALMDHDGNVLTSFVTNKIRNFNTDAKYLVTKDTKYHLYTFNGESKTPSGFDYIALDNKYFSAVNNQTLNIYSYDEPSIQLIEGIKLERNNYYGEGTLAFMVNITGTRATIKIGRNDNSYDTKTVSLIKQSEKNDED